MSKPRIPADVDGVLTVLQEAGRPLAKSEISARLHGGNASRVAAVTEAIAMGKIKPAGMAGVKRYAIV